MHILKVALVVPKQHQFIEHKIVLCLCRGMLKTLCMKCMASIVDILLEQLCKTCTICQIAFHLVSRP